MPKDFFSIENVVSVEAARFRLKRSVDLLAAVRRNRDFELIELLQRSVGETSALECLIVDVACDGVPSRNPTGIAYPERIALIVPAEEKEQVEVWALRKDFPILLHQNQVVEGMPVNLCLFLASKAAILRSWTAERFLRRIQWWLEIAATEKLHSEDQPLEQLFFECPFELVLPWNFSELSADSNKRFSAVQAKPRPDGGRTFFIRELLPEARAALQVALIELKLQPVIHGLEREPANLGQLIAALDKRGADLASALKEAIQARVGEGGVDVAADETKAIIMLQVPTRRHADGPVERIRTRAFMLGAGALMKVGASMGALFLPPGGGKTYYCDRTGQLTQPTEAWKDEPIFPMEILRSNSAEDFRNQSGIADVGGAMVMIGAGALGSAMLNLWGRSGWGEWTVIDKDHVKPHNLTRHVAYSSQIGQPKAEAVANLHDSIMGRSGGMATIVADACDFSQAAVVGALKSATLVVDVSTTLEYPRLVSFQQDVGRHASTFISPDGNSSVLMVESEDRAVRLRVLEAVYYRAIINEDWGKEHLDGNLGTFFSGVSCRDISLVLPFSCITSHASILAEQIRAANAVDPCLEAESVHGWGGNARHNSVPRAAVECR